jgi:hypothetical protein
MLCFLILSFVFVGNALTTCLKMHEGGCDIIDLAISGSIMLLYFFIFCDRNE